MKADGKRRRIQDQSSGQLIQPAGPFLAEDEVLRRRSAGHAAPNAAGQQRTKRAADDRDLPEEDRSSAKRARGSDPYANEDREVEQADVDIAPAQSSW